MIGCCPQSCDSGSATSRATTSSELPAAVCTMILTGFDGKSCAQAVEAAVIAAMNAAARQMRDTTDRSMFIATVPGDESRLYRARAGPRSFQALHPSLAA